MTTFGRLCCKPLGAAPAHVGHGDGESLSRLSGVWLLFLEGRGVFYPTKELKCAPATTSVQKARGLLLAHFDDAIVRNR
jgi:hypothetical protein